MFTTDKISIAISRITKRKSRKPTKKFVPGADENAACAYMNGDGAAMEGLIRRYADSTFNRCYQFCLPRCGYNRQAARDKAEDISHDIWQKVFIKLSEGKYTPCGPFAAWFKVLRENHLRDVLKKREIIFAQPYRKQDEEDEKDFIADIADSSPIADAYVLSKDFSAAFGNCTRNLPEKTRQVIVMAVSNKTQRQMAAVHEVAAATINNWLKAGYHEMKKCLETLGWDGASIRQWRTTNGELFRNIE